MTRKLYVVGNWKMYKTAREATDYIEELLPKIADCKAKLYLAVPFTSLALAASFAKESPLVIGAQNMNDARDGAFTGEIAGLMLKEAGAAFVLLGHSERRHVFGETNAFIHRKVLRALADDIEPILCIGETLQEREAGQTEEVLKRQIETALDGVAATDAGRLILAYEPVWAIGTGQTATPQIAQEAHAYCRTILESLFGKRKAAAISILYGGSVKHDNASHLIAQKDIDGVLIGGASLDPHHFATIALSCNKKGNTE
jgi:triosephosphate isomerase